MASMFVSNTDNENDRDFVGMRFISMCVGAFHWNRFKPVFSDNKYGIPTGVVFGVNRLKIG